VIVQVETLGGEPLAPEHAHIPYYTKA